MDQDRIEDFESDKHPNSKHPRFTQKLIGHEAPKEIFMKSYRSGKLHHSWLIHGPAGVGKATFAWQIAKFLLNNYLSLETAHQEIKSSISQRIEALSEPSLFLCRRQYDKTRKRYFQEISVDEIRKIKHFFSLSNTHSQWRITIIDSVEDLSNSAANALLKILEEPPRGGIFLLVCKNKAEILPTIVSRCRSIRFSSLNWKEFEEVFLSLDPNIKEADMIRLFALTNGSISKAINIALNDGVDIFSKILEIINFKDQIDRKKIWDLLDHKNDSGIHNDHYILIKELILLALSRISQVLTKKDIGLHLPEEKNIFESYSKYTDAYFPFSWLHLFLVNNFKDAEQLNLDPIDTLLESFLKIENVLLKVQRAEKKTE